MSAVSTRGCIQITDRAKDVITSGGEWISSVDSRATCRRTRRCWTPPWSASPTGAGRSGRSPWWPSLPRPGRWPRPGSVSPQRWRPRRGQRRSVARARGPRRPRAARHRHARRPDAHRRRRLGAARADGVDRTDPAQRRLTSTACGRPGRTPDVRIPPQVLSATVEWPARLWIKVTHVWCAYSHTGSESPAASACARVAPSRSPRLHGHFGGSLSRRLAAH